MKIRVLHAYYGCETGCCGHIIEIDDEEYYESFEFGHADESDRDSEEFRKRVQKFVARFIPDACVDSIDWESIEFDADPSWC